MLQIRGAVPFIAGPYRTRCVAVTARPTLTSAYCPWSVAPISLVSPSPPPSPTKENAEKKSTSDVHKTSKPPEDRVRRSKAQTHAYIGKARHFTRYYSRTSTPLSAARKDGTPPSAPPPLGPACTPTARTNHHTEPPGYYHPGPAGNTAYTRYKKKKKISQAHRMTSKVFAERLVRATFDKPCTPSSLSDTRVIDRLIDSHRLKTHCVHLEVYQGYEVKKIWQSILESFDSNTAAGVGVPAL
ncbi:hypothetical protein GWK47_002336 [Chionoecetes opilio]|uniref:Uncharacterized protein n=1 Tax=Chionoecetes opilio TaxID=41210 RepID=A0A8J4XPP3_CHIOP|nr:hypothetical protein GWK47_002336 [Chionoecetes opilio]